MNKLVNKSQILWDIYPQVELFYITKYRECKIYHDYEQTTGCLFTMGRSSFIDTVARMERSVIRGFDSMDSRITQASYGLRNIIQSNLALLIAMKFIERKLEAGQ